MLAARAPQGTGLPFRSWADRTRCRVPAIGAASGGAGVGCHRGGARGVRRAVHSRFRTGPRRPPGHGSQRVDHPLHRICAPADELLCTIKQGGIARPILPLMVAFRVISSGCDLAHHHRARKALRTALYSRAAHHGLGRAGLARRRNERAANP